MNWAIKYRPQFLNEVVGNSKVVYLLNRYIKRGDLPKALLFYGKSGCGKTTLAGVVANEIGGMLYEFNTANTRGIDTVRGIVEMCKYKELTGRKRVIVFDECHQLTVDAQNALLKLLEGEDSFNMFILCTTDKDKLLETIVNRCVVMEVMPLSYNECYELIKKRIEKAEKVNYAEEVISYVWKKNKGVVRNILNDLQSVIEVADDLKKVKKYLKKVDIIDKHDMVEFCSDLLRGNLSWEVVGKYINSIGEDEINRFIGFGRSYVCSAVLNSSEDRLKYYGDVLRVFLYANDRVSLVYNLVELFNKYKD
jgi:DNA polymerase-3 subunit gamma/tau